MNAKVGIRASACVTGLVVVTVLAILVPSTYWTLCSVVATAALSLSIIAPPFVPLPTPKVGGTDAAGIWLIGPMSIWLGILVIVAASALWLALHQLSTVAWALIVVWVGLSLGGWTSLSASTDVVALASSQSQSASRDARAQWMAALSALSAQASGTDAKNILEALAERIRYAANDNPSASVAQNGQISSLVLQLHSALDNSEELNRIARTIEGLLMQREHAIRLSRSFA